jgi:gelsolin
LNQNPHTPFNMQKQETVDIADSNIANYGSKEHKDAKLAAAKTEKAWEGCGEKVGIEIWRIEKFQVVHWPKDQYGSFYSGDSYIVLNTYLHPENDKKKLYNVHFWLGAESSQDEKGVAAYKTVELDDLLGDLPVQYREVQGHESKEFMQCFKNPIKIMEGGIESGFNKISPETYVPRLMHMKGRGEFGIRVTQVDCKRESLNDGDVFVLDAGMMIWQWNGRKAHFFEKRKGNQIVTGLKEDRNGKPKSCILDGPEEDDEFWALLGGMGDIAPETEDVKMEEYEKALYRLSDETGTVVITDVAKGKGNILKKDLVEDDVMILDLGHKVYAWIGNGASKKERATAISKAMEFIGQKGLPEHTPVRRVLQGVETPCWHEAFDG